MASLYKPDDLEGYRELQRWLLSLRDRGQVSEWGDAMRWYIANDLFFFVTNVLSDGRTINTDTGRRLYLHPCYLDWCRQIEWQIAHGGGFDGSARGTGKSTLRTKAANIQRIVKHPNSTGCIFSFQRKHAKKHFRTIREELEANTILKTVYDDVLWEDPRTAAKNGETIWSADEGFRVKGANRKDLTLEYQAFMDGTPTGGRFDWLDFDDVEDYKAVGSAEMLKKQHETYDATVLLLTPVALKQPVENFTNTFYSESGLAYRVYERLRRQDERKVRVEPGEDLDRPGDGPLGGTPQYPFSKKRLFIFYEKIRDRREYAIQICGDFLAGEDRTLESGWLQFYREVPEDLGREKTIYICIDPSKGVTDPMVIWVWGLGADRRAYWLDGLRRRLDPALPEFWDAIFLLHSKWSNLARVVEIRVENFGQATYDTQIASELERRGAYVPVVACADNLRTYKFDSGKRDREFERWAGPAASGRVVFPVPHDEGGPGLVRADEEGQNEDLVKLFLEAEWRRFPHPLHDDMLDAGSLLWEPEQRVGPLQYPSLRHRSTNRRSRRSHRGATAMSAG